MRPMVAGDDPRQWLAEASRIRTYRHPGNHRYVFVYGADVRVIDVHGRTLRAPAKKVRRSGRPVRDVRIAKRVLDHTHYPKRVETRELVTA